MTERSHLRTTLPVLFAIGTVVILLLFLWWELKKTSERVLVQPTNSQPSVSIITPRQKNNIEPSSGPMTALRQGDIYALEGNWTAAEAAYSQAVAEQGGLAALRKLAQAQLQRRDYQAAQITISKLASNGASESDVLLLNSIVLLRTGEIVQARELLSAAGDTPQAQYGLALLAIAEGNHQAAKQNLASVQTGIEPILRNNAEIIQAAYDEYALFPDSSDLHLITLLARALSQVQECELALPLLAQVTNKQTDYRDAWLVQGYCELFTERTQKAVASFETAYTLDPQKTATQYFLGRAYFAREDYLNAITFFEYALGNGFSPASELHNLLATAALQTNNALLAFSQYEQIIAIESTANNYAQYMQLGLQVGKATEAYQVGLQATQQFKNNAALWELFGLAAEAIGNQPEAINAFTKANELEPEREVSQAKLVELQ